MSVGGWLFWGLIWLAIVGVRIIRLKLGKFLRDKKPEFKGTIQGAGGGEADAGDSASDRLVQAGSILRGSGGFEGREGDPQALGKQPWAGEQVCDSVEIAVVVRIECLRWDISRGEIGAELCKEFGEPGGAYLAKNCGLGEEFKVGGIGYHRYFPSSVARPVGHPLSKAKKTR